MCGLDPLHAHLAVIEKAMIADFLLNNNIFNINLLYNCLITSKCISVAKIGKPVLCQEVFAKLRTLSGNIQSKI